MKVRLTLIVFSLISISALTLSARTTSGADNLETAAIAAPASGMESREVSNVLGVPSGVPRGPSELLHDYEAEMSAITQRFGDEVAAIANAVHSGQLTSDQGQQITAEQYQLAQMQFEVLSAWHDMLAQDLSRTNQGTEDREEGTERKRSPRTVQQELDHLTKDLELTPTQQKKSNRCWRSTTRRFKRCASRIRHSHGRTWLHKSTQSAHKLITKLKRCSPNARSS